MNAALKEMSFEGALAPSAKLFGKLGEMLSSHEKRLTPHIVSIGLKKTVQQIQKGATPQEILVLRGVILELAEHLDRLGPAMPSHVPAGTLVDAAREDSVVERVLQKASEGKSPVVTTQKSIREGNEAVFRGLQAAAATLKDRIERKELISSGELQSAWQVGRQAISNALRAGRIFAFVGPSGDHYYPSFFIDESVDRRTVEKVAKALGSLPAAAKYHFFTNTFTALETSPLEALRAGRLAEVLGAASTFAGR